MFNPQEHDALYLPGLENRLTRYYFYLRNGLNVINESRNLILAILGVYIALKWDNWLLLPLMFVVSVLILLVVGFYATHKANKVLEWLGTRFGSHYAIRQYNINQETLDVLKEIRDTMKK